MKRGIFPTTLTTKKMDRAIEMKLCIIWRAVYRDSNFLSHLIECPPNG